MMRCLFKKRFCAKAQVSVEFIMLFGITFFLFLLLLGVSVYYNTLQGREQTYTLLQDLASKVRLESDLASTVSDGYCRNFTIPLKVNFKDYNMSVVKQELTLKQGQYEFSEWLSNFTGALKKGNNRICKTGGMVRVN